MWHGANWTFIAWGLMYFVILTIEKLTGLGKKSYWWGHLYTMVLVIIGWVIFRSTGMGNAFLYIKAMFGIGVSPIPMYPKTSLEIKVYKRVVRIVTNK